MKYLISTFLLFFSAISHAEYTMVYHTMNLNIGYYSTELNACLARAYSYDSRYIITDVYVNVVDDYNECRGTRSDTAFDPPMITSNFRFDRVRDVGYNSGREPIDAGLPQVTTDEYCQSLDPQTLRVPSTVGTGDLVAHAGCEWQIDTSQADLISAYPNNDFDAVFIPIGAEPEAPPEPDQLPPPEPDLGTGWDAPLYSDVTPTSDPSLDCPWSYVTSSDGSAYCYSGPDASHGEEYADSSVRVNHYDGSYTVTDSEGGSVTYNPDGSPTGTASTSPGGVGPGTDDTGCPPWAPRWMCDGDADSLSVTVVGDGEGDGDGEGITLGEGWGDGVEGDGEGGTGEFSDPGLPVQEFDFGTDAITYDSGLPTTGTCPAPQTAAIGFGAFSTDLEISYQPFCDLAAILRALVLAAAYMSAAFLVFRGLT